jgi:hypothetical protein
VSTSTLPRIAADLDGNGMPFYAAAWDGSADDETNVIWLNKPVLIPGHHWAVEAQVTSPHVTLDMAAIAKLLYAAEQLPVPVPVASVCTSFAPWVIDAVLTWCHCDLAGIVGDLAQEYGEHQELAQPRMARCVAVAETLCGTGVTP